MYCIIILTILSITLLFIATKIIRLIIEIITLKQIQASFFKIFFHGHFYFFLNLFHSAMTDVHLKCRLFKKWLRILDIYQNFDILEISLDSHKFFQLWKSWHSVIIKFQNALIYFDSFDQSTNSCLSKLGSNWTLHKERSKG